VEVKEEEKPVVKKSQNEEDHVEKMLSKIHRRKVMTNKMNLQKFRMLSDTASEKKAPTE
jgi:hypothetical protein